MLAGEAGDSSSSQKAEAPKEKTSEAKDICAAAHLRW